MDVGAGVLPQCSHPLSVDFPGGFFAPPFCIPGLNFTVSVVQTGCGIGELDSNGGADYTISEVGDTSDSSAVCNLPQPCMVGLDNAARVDVKVGDGQADACASGGTASALISIPVFTTTWARVGSCGPEFECPETSPGCCNCPDADGAFSAGDTLVLQFPQTLDLTTDTAAGDFADLDGDGCCLAGAGPASVLSGDCTPGSGMGGNSAAGRCLDLEQSTVTGAAAGAIGSAGAPLFDLTFASVLPGSFVRTGDVAFVVCEDPPLLPIGALAGTVASRCVSE
jgi:hypothetical protein